MRVEADLAVLLSTCRIDPWLISGEFGKTNVSLYEYCTGRVGSERSGKVEVK